jgi:hypothetical protein
VGWQVWLCDVATQVDIELEAASTTLGQ